MTPFRSLLLSLALAATASAQSVVVVTNAVLRDIVSHVGGDDVQVETLVPDTTDPIEYDPTDADREKLANAIMVVSNGIGLEPWLDDFLEKARYTGTHIVATDDVALFNFQGQPYSTDAAPGMDAPDPDPYAWFDPRAVEVYVENIRSALSTLVPTKKVAFAANAEAYKGELAKAYEYAQTQLGRISPGNRKLVTSFDCFGYFARAYGFTIGRIPGMASGQQLRPAVLDRLVAIASPFRPKAVFVERTANINSLRELSGALGAKVDNSLFGHLLGPPNTPAATYIGMFRWDVDAITAALADPAPPSADAGKQPAAPAKK